MPVRNCIIHFIDKQPYDGSARVHFHDAALPASNVVNQMLLDLQATYYATKETKWGFFEPQSEIHPFSRWLQEYLDDDIDFAGFSQASVEHLSKLLPRHRATSGGHVYFAHSVEAMTDYLFIAVLRQSEGVAMTSELGLLPVRHLNLNRLTMAARINLTQWQENHGSKLYLSYLGGQIGSECFRDFLGCRENIKSAHTR